MPETILVVDDTPANISVLVDALADTGHQLLLAEDGSRPGGSQVRPFVQR